MVELARRAHIYTEEEIVDMHFLPFLAACTTHPDEGVTEAAIWVEVSDITFSTAATASTIRSPIHRLLHTIVTCTLTQHHKGGDKVPKKDLRFLWALLRVDRFFHLPYLLVVLVEFSASSLVGGHYITRIRVLRHVADRGY